MKPGGWPWIVIDHAALPVIGLGLAVGIAGWIADLPGWCP